MRLPKTVQISGITYPVKKNNQSYDGGGSTTYPHITVGTKSKNNERHLEILIHEIMEVAACERGYRYGGGISDGSVFVMSHKEFDNFSCDVATAIRPMIKK